MDDIPFFIITLLLSIQVLTSRDNYGALATQGKHSFCFGNIH